MLCYTDAEHFPYEIDDEDWEIVSHYETYVNNGYYISLRIFIYYQMDGEYYRLPYHIKLHQLLLGIRRDGLEWDHIDCNKYNNHRWNLRAISKRENQLNRKPGKSGHRGIHHYKQTNKWAARILPSESPTKEAIHLGCFDTLEEAIQIRKSCLGVR